jgi:predicted Co/Zn/Cd cation transporter (cation efflux family)
MSALHFAEQNTLRMSIAMTVVLGVLGIASGLGTGSQAMIFDGMYSFVDVVPSIVSLLVVKLLAQGTSQRFQYGYWHLEPLVMVLRDSILVVACIYAAVGAVKTLSSGGQVVEYGRAAMWAGILCIIGLAMTLFVFRRAKQLQSPMLTVDARSWAMSAILSVSLLIGFAIGAAITRTRYQGWIPYVDSIVLLALAAVMLPVPLVGLWRSMRDVLQIAPGDFDLQVHAVMDSLVKERGFLEYSSYVAKVGRGQFVEIHVLVSAESRIDIAAADAIRREVSDRLKAGTPTTWLTIDFTADRRWL